MCAIYSPTESGPRGANAVGEEHLRRWQCAECMEMCTGMNSVILTQV